jgi:hypothetical protein
MILVVGAPRMRTSMLMQALRGMDLPILGVFQPTEMNQGGNGEAEVSTIGLDTEWGSKDSAVKLIIDAFLFRTKIHPGDKVIFCLRKPADVSASQGKWNIWKPTDELRRFNYWRLLTQFHTWMMSTQLPVLIVDTDDMIVNSKVWLDKIREFVGAEAFVDTVKPEWTALPLEEINDDALAIYTTMRDACYATT